MILKRTLSSADVHVSCKYAVYNNNSYFMKLVDLIQNLDNKPFYTDLQNVYHIKDTFTNNNSFVRFCFKLFYQDTGFNINPC